MGIFDDQDFLAVATDQSCVLQFRKMAMEPVPGHSGGLLQDQGRGRADQKQAENEQAPRMGKSRGDPDGGFILGRREKAERIQQGAQSSVAAQ